MDKIFETAREVWNRGAQFRARRNRMKAYTYGDQWSDPCTLADGSVVTEAEKAMRNGARPITNNLLRQLVKSVVGNFRAMRAEAGDKPVTLAGIAARNQLDELDARALEEFLISGCVVQRVVRERRQQGCGVWVDNISPARFFVAPFSDPRGHDIEMLGMIHDMSMAEVVMRFGNNDPVRENEIVDIYSTLAAPVDGMGLFPDNGADFTSAPQGRCRVIEVWTLEAVEMLRCHDKSVGRIFSVPLESRDRVDSVNAVRRGCGLDGIETWPRRSVRWRGSWFTPGGHLLFTTLSPWRHGRHPFAIKLYPLIDGEVHPFVEDIIDQQRHVNRLITLIDQLMSVSAKGALLFPLQCRPKGIELRALLEQWGQPGAIIPYDETSRGSKPTVVNTPADASGAGRLLDIELQMIQQVSGVSGALQGMKVDGIGGSASLYNAQAANSATALRDIFDTFGAFTEARNALILGT